MSNPTKSVGQALKDAVKNATDTVKEASHRSAAEGERIKREAEGEAMTPGEKLGSAANELKNRVQAEADRVKREARNNS
jgi:hypothetical protein